MTNIYRISPVLWNDGICKQAQTVYAIDRAPPPGLFPTTCSSRVKEDPAYYWDNPTFQRLLPAPQSGSGSGCYQPAQLNSVRWGCLPAWLSYVSTLGYTYQGDMSQLNPLKDFFITGP